MTAPARFVLCVIGIVVAAAALMAPRRDEWLAILNDEGNHARVISLLEPRLAHSPNDPGLLGPLARAYTESRSYERAIDLLERYTAIRPKDAKAYAVLSELYAKTGDVARSAESLRRAIAIKPALPYIEALASLYRRQQKMDEELALLSQFEAELTFKSGLLSRLAHLRAEGRDREGAIRVLMRPEIASGWSEPWRSGEARLLLAKLLVESGQSREVVRLGTHWIWQWQEPYLANRLLLSTVLRMPAADAFELADTVVTSHPEIRLFLVHELVMVGAKSVAHHLLERWVDANPSPSPNEIAAFLTACREQGDPGLVWRAFGEVLGHSRRDEVIARYTDAISAEFGIGALAPFWSRLSRGVLERRPLLAAHLAFHEGDLRTAKRLLEQVDPNLLGASARQIWIGLLTASASPREVFGLLRNRRRLDRLPRDLLVKYAQLAGEFGQEIEYRSALADLAIEVR